MNIKVPETSMQNNQVVEKKVLNSVTKKITIYAPDIAAKAHPGQFVIFKIRSDSERIPLTLSSWDKEKGTISHIFQEVGYSTIEMGSLHVDDKIMHVAGPLGNPSEIKNFGTAAVICGGLGTAVAYPVAKALKEAGNKVVSIMGARSAELFILEDEMKAVSDEVFLHLRRRHKRTKRLRQRRLKITSRKKHQNRHSLCHRAPDYDECNRRHHPTLRNQNHRQPQPHHGRRHGHVRCLPSLNRWQNTICLRRRPRI